MAELEHTPTPDLKTLIDAVDAMREAQKLEWAALPANFNIYKRARAGQSVALKEARVDALVQALKQAHPWA